MSNVRDAQGSILRLRCDGKDACEAQVSHIDEKGFVYCQPHGIARRTYSGKRCRQLKPAEVKSLLAGEPLKSY